MTKPKKYRGVVVPMITPFTANGKVDIPAAKKITEHLISSNNIPFILGTTGESSSVPNSERSGFVRAVVEQVAGRCLTYAGISSNCFEESVELAKQYADLGLDVAVCNLACYYPLTTENMLKYYEELAESIPLPLMIYNITITTNMSIPLDIIEKLSAHPNIIGLKDSERDEERMAKAVKMANAKDDFAYFSGCAAFAARAMLAGADGIVPSTANFIPKMFYDLYDAGAKGDGDTANKLQAESDALAKIYQGGRILCQSLAALKVVMKCMGLCEEYVLPPLFELPEEEKQTIKNKLKEAGVTN